MFHYLGMSTRAQWLRRLATRRRDRTAFVFSGGGPLGALQVGALRALFEHGIGPDLAVGTSAGALNATFVAFDPSLDAARRLESIWLDLHDGDIFPSSRFKATWARMFSRGDRIFDNSGIKRLVESRLGDARFEDAQIPLAVVATELETGAEEVFTSGELLKPLLASTAMPAVFPPVEIDGRRFIDGGVSDQVPITPAIALGAKTIYVLNAAANTHRPRPLNRPIDYLLHAFTLARYQRLSFEQSFYASAGVRLVVIPIAPLEFFVPFASVAHTSLLIQHAYESATRFLSGLSEVGVDKRADAGLVEEISPAK